MTKSKAVDISKFDAIAVESEGQPFELYFKGDKTGITLLVLGQNADPVREFASAKLREYARQSHFASKKGGDAELNQSLKLLDNREQTQIEHALVRVVGWEGASYQGSEAFSKEGLESLLKRNPAWVNEIIEYSAELGK